MKRRLVITKDQSPTLYVPELDQHYHSIHGAIAESMHVFIDAGLKPFLTDSHSINILEMGFGTGLNAWLSANYASEHNLQIRYHALEKYPLTEDEAKALDFDGVNEELMALHEAPWNSWHSISDNFDLKKEQVDLLEFESMDHYHLLYYDAFAPSAQPKLWTEEIFAKLYDKMFDGGIMVTYCVKGDVKEGGEICRI